jgi:hypothetical protein
LIVVYRERKREERERENGLEDQDEPLQAREDRRVDCAMHILEYRERPPDGLLRFLEFACVLSQLTQHNTYYISTGTCSSLRTSEFVDGSEGLQRGGQVGVPGAEGFLAYLRKIG